jgi:CheY-like chemotaxis protein
MTASSGLAKAAQQTYDVIFLDVEMPGLNGFETCSKIHQNDSNKSTPIVFVTKHSDFGSRAQSAIVGGFELIGKPFIPLEVAVKTLALVLASRLGIGRPVQHVTSPPPAESVARECGVGS